METGTIEVVVSFGIDARAATTGLQGWPNTATNHPPFVIRISASGTGRHGRALTGGGAIRATTGLAQTYFASSAAAGSDTIVVQDVAHFATGQQIDVYEPSLPGNRDTTEIIAISGNTLTLRPALTHSHPKGAMVVAIGGARGLVFPANGRLGILHKTFVPQIASSALVLPFRPNITSPVIIAMEAIGVSVIPEITGYTFAPPIQIKSETYGYIAPIFRGSINAEMQISGWVYSDTEQMSGDINADIIFIPEITGRGYTLVGSIVTPVIIANTGVGALLPTAFIVSRLRFTPEITAAATAINSLYGEVQISTRSYAFTDPSRGSISMPVGIGCQIDGQVFGSLGAIYGSQHGTLSVTATLTGKAIPVGQARDLSLNLIMGRSESTGGIDHPVFHPALGTSFLAPGVPVPTDFFYGSIPPVPRAFASFTLTGTHTSDAVLAIGDDAVTDSISANTLAEFISKLVSELSPRGYWVKVSGNTVTIMTPAAMGSTPNGETISVFRADGDIDIVGDIQLSGGERSNVTIKTDIRGRQYDDDATVGVIDADIVFDPDINGSLIGNGGSIVSTVKITGRLYNGVFGASVAKLNVNAAIEPPVAVIAYKATVHPIIVDPPSSQHIAKAVAYAVIAPGDSDAYEAMFFF